MLLKEFLSLHKQNEKELILALSFFRKEKPLNVHLSEDKALSKKELKFLEDVIKRLSKNEPIQYIIGKWEFYGLDIFIEPPVLIPRQETEILVYEAIRIIKEEFKNKNILGLEIGLGSGAISVAMLKNLKNVKIIGTDINLKACFLSYKNAKKHKVRKRLFIINTSLDEAIKNNIKLDFIISNPPYIPSSKIKLLDKSVRDFEDIKALAGNKDGLYFYRKIKSIAKNRLKKNGFLFLEIGHDQKEKIEEIFKDFSFVSIIKDFQNQDRVAIIKK